MSVFERIFNSHGRSVGLVPFALLACAITAHSQVRNHIWSETTPVPPYALMQNATISGSGNAINASFIPVITANGTTIYQNLVLQFDVDQYGNLTIAAGYPQFFTPPTPITSSFVAGTYDTPEDVNVKIIISGPGVTDGGATEWTLASDGGEPYPENAMWYVGPLASNPLYARIQAAGITSTAYSYGIGGDVYATHTGTGVSTPYLDSARWATRLPSSASRIAPEKITANR